MGKLGPFWSGALIALALIVPIAFFAVYTRGSIDAEIAARGEADRDLTVRLAGELVRQRLDAQTAALGRLARGAEVYQKVRAGDAGGLDDILTSFISPRGMKLAGVVDPSGRLVAHQPGDDVDPTFAKDVAATATALPPTQDWTYLAPDGRHPTSAYAVTVIVERFRVDDATWAMYGLLDCEPFVSVFAPLRLPDYRALALVDEVGRVIASADPGDHTNAPGCVDLIAFPGLHRYPLNVNGISAALAGPVGQGTETLGETEYLAAHIPVLPGQWVVYLLDAKREALTGQDALDRQITAGAAIAAVVAALFAFALAWLVARVRRQGTQLARLAVTDERLRFARDLHDLLGRGLSLIAIKAALAGRLLPSDMPRARREIEELETVARDALRDMRGAVVGYRQPTLAAELEGARSMLDGAGIACRIDQERIALPEAVNTLFAWAVREGVTNVVRHSAAATCSIRIHGREDTAAVEVSDDGVGGAGLRDGSGLRGLAERAAAHGGSVEAGALPERGFRLLVTVPLGGGSSLRSAPHA